MNQRMHQHNHQSNINGGKQSTGGTSWPRISRKVLMRKRRARTMSVLGIQPAGLQVGAANDKYEQEANRVAEHVMNSPGPADGAGSSGVGVARRLPRSGGGNLEIDRDQDANIVTKRIQRDAHKGYDDEAKAKPLVQRKCRTCEQEARRTVPANANPAVDHRKPTVGELSLASAEHYMFIRMFCAYVGWPAYVMTPFMIGGYYRLIKILQALGIESIAGQTDAPPLRMTACQPRWAYKGIDPGLADRAKDAERRAAAKKK